jgi:hypothetical protein
MRVFLSSRIMRTTIDIDAPILREIKVLQKGEGKTLGALVSELLADALARRRSGEKATPFRWISREMQALVDLNDKEALYAEMDERT